MSEQICTRMVHPRGSKLPRRTSGEIGQKHVKTQQPRSFSWQQTAEGGLRRCQDEENLEDKVWSLYFDIDRDVVKGKNNL